jgi:hypothetical protein
MHLDRLTVHDGGPLNAVAFSPDGRRLAGVSGGNLFMQPNTVAVWDATPLEGR